MKIFASCLMGTTALVLGFSASPVLASTIAQWNFDTIGTQSAPYNSPNATTDNTGDNNNAGAPVATPLGMLNNYAYTSGGSTIAVGSVPNCDILKTAGLTGSGASNYADNAWRVRGPATNGYNSSAGTPTGTGNGWNLAAPQYSQGVEFDADTTGYSNIALAFNYYCTTQGVKNMEVQYNNNTNNPNGWTNLEALVSVSDDWYGSSQNAIVVNMPADANNDPNFGVRMVSAYDPTTGDTSYSSAAGGLYNNSSGNWRFGTVTIESVPEPSTFALLAVAAIAGIFSFRRTRRPSR
ncbi:MAG: PEP-CTERM sorting domain-containing protein [Thermoguttaceae bacterium]